MFFKNKETGLTWEITDEGLISRLSQDSNYEEVAEKAKEDKKETKATKG